MLMLMHIKNMNPQKPFIKLCDNEVYHTWYNKTMLTTVQVKPDRVQQHQQLLQPHVQWLVETRNPEVVGLYNVTTHVVDVRLRRHQHGQKTGCHPATAAGQPVHKSAMHQSAVRATPGSVPLPQNQPGRQRNKKVGRRKVWYLPTSPMEKSVCTNRLENMKSQKSEMEE